LIWSIVECVGNLWPFNQLKDCATNCNSSAGGSPIPLSPQTPCILDCGCSVATALGFTDPVGSVIAANLLRFLRRERLPMIHLISSRPKLADASVHPPQTRSSNGFQVALPGIVPVGLSQRNQIANSNRLQTGHAISSRLRGIAGDDVLQRWRSARPRISLPGPRTISRRLPSRSRTSPEFDKEVPKGRQLRPNFHGNQLERW
jgi:hypothetical protein